MTLASIPSPTTAVWQIGPLPIRAYALFIILGIVIACAVAETRMRARGAPKWAVLDLAVWAVPFGIIGARLYHVITSPDRFFGEGGDPVSMLYVWEGGLGIWGAIALGALGAWIGCRRRGVPLGFFADAVAPGIVAAQAIGRLGNWFNQELYGAPTTLPWGLEIYERIDPATGLPDALGGVAVDHTPVQVVHPTFLYELLWNLAVAGLVVWADRRFRLGHGRAFAVYVAGYTAGRFFIEQMRTDHATRVFGDIRINVVVAAVVFAAAVLYIALVRKPREVLGAPPGAAEPAGAAKADADPDGSSADRGSADGGTADGATDPGDGAASDKDAAEVGDCAP